MSCITLPITLDCSVNNSPGIRLTKCRARGHSYAGITNTTCVCADGSPEFAKVPDEACDMECLSDTSQKCVGFFTLGQISMRWASVVNSSDEPLPLSTFCVMPFVLPANIGLNSNRTADTCVNGCKAKGKTLTSIGD